MAKKKLQFAPPVNEKGEEVVKDFEIKSASIKDNFCNYTYELLTGVSKGDICNRDGHSEIHEDMTKMFQLLNVHLAIIDDAFKNSEIKDIKVMRDHELTLPYYVSGFKITGSEENKSVVLIGSKWATQGVFTLTTPKVKLESAAYDFIDDLKDALIRCKQEVELYMSGKFHQEEKLPEFDFPEQEDDFAQAAV